MSLKTNHEKKVLTFGDLIESACRACGKRRARGIIRLAVNAHLIEFRGHQLFVVS